MMRKIYVLGAGTPTPTKYRFGTSYVLQLANDFLMFDCGPAATHKLVTLGLFPTQIDYLFFTHHHFDHNVDYPCFLLCRWDQSIGRENILQIWGPPPTEWITERLIGPDGAFNHDWKARVEHPSSQNVFLNRGGSLPRPKPAYNATDIEPGEVIRKDHWTVTAAEAKHVEPYLRTLAYRVDSDEGSIVFSGDTGPCETIKKLAEGADTLLVHCWDHQEKMAIEIAKAIAGTLESAKIAQESRVKRLILSHQGSDLARPGSREKGIADISKIFDGEIIFAEELTTFELR